MSRPFSIAILAIGLIFVMRVLGTDFGDLYAMLKSRLAAAAADTRSLTRGEYSERTAQRLRAEAAERIRAEAASVPPVVPGAPDDDELRRELATERKRILKEKADQAERAVGHVVSGDLDSLKRQVEQHARMAGGAPRRRRARLER
jgi:hypothetical protein